MKTAVVNKQDFSIATIYEGEPNQAGYGGPWGDPNQYGHYQIPDGMLADQSVLVFAMNDEGQVTVREDSAKKAAAQAAAQKQAIMAAIAKQQTVCDNLFNDFKYENSILGIRTDGKKDEVLQKMAPVLQAIQTGDCDLVVQSMQAIPQSDYDDKYITAARLLKYKNMIETALGVPVSTTL